MANRIAGFLVILTVFCTTYWCVYAGDIIDDAAKDAKKAAKDNDIAKVNAAVNMISRSNNAKAMKTLLELAQDISRESEEFYWAVLNGVALINNPDAGPELVSFVAKHKKKPVAVDVVFILKSSPNEKMIPVMESLLKDNPEEIKLLVIEYVNAVEFKTAVPALIRILKGFGAAEANVRKQTAKTLESRTGGSFGENAEAWEKWWAENRDGVEPVMPVKAARGGPGRTARDFLDGARKSDVESIGGSAGEIIVVDGQCVCGNDHSFDNLEDVLRQLRIPFKLVDRRDFDAPSYTLDKKTAILFNCNFFRDHCVCPLCKPGGDPTMRLFQCTGCDIHEKGSNKLSDKTIEKIRAYVADGGYVFTEDWELEEILERAFPDYLGHKDYLGEQHVKILPERGSTAHPYLKGVFERPAGVQPGGDSGGSVAEKPQLKVGEGEWKIDKDSPNIVVKKTNDVTVLMMSPDLKKIDAGTPGVAVTFNYAGRKKAAIASGPDGRRGGGVVLHVLSHFGKQKSKGDEFALQNLLLNFLAEASAVYKAAH
ncbi:MAG: hypothetical protein HZA48_08340 [Planctomycetes bacterium]|nr:hypothetical protein [Planctomycetota bacterium]